MPKVSSEFVWGVLGIIVIVIGVAIWNVAQQPMATSEGPVVNSETKPNQSDSSVVPSATTVESATSNTDQGYLVVKELGFKFPVDPTTPGEFTYTVEGSTASFSSKSLNVIDPGCADAAAGTTIEKILGTPAHPVGQGDGDMPKIDTHFYAARLSHAKQFDGFFLFLTTPQASCTSGKNIDLESKVAKAISDGFQKSVLIDQLTSAVDASATTKNSLMIPLQSLNGTVLRSMSLDMPGGWGKTGERVDSENTDAPKTIEQKYAGPEGELTLTNLYQGGACMTEGGYKTVKSATVTFSVCLDSVHNGARFNSVNIGGRPEADTVFSAISGSIQFKTGVNAANQKSFLENLLKTATEGK